MYVSVYTCPDIDMVDPFIEPFFDSACCPDAFSRKFCCCCMCFGTWVGPPNEAPSLPNMLGSAFGMVVGCTL